MRCISYTNSLYGGILKPKWQSHRIPTKSNKKRQNKGNKHNSTSNRRSRRLKLKLYTKMTLQQYIDDINCSDPELELNSSPDLDHMTYDKTTNNNSCRICKEYIDIDSSLQVQIFDIIYNLCTKCAMYDDGMKYHYLYCEHNNNNNNNITNCHCLDKQQFISNNTTTFCIKYMCCICQRFCDKMQLLRHKNGEYYICLGCDPFNEWRDKLDLIQFTQCVECKCWNYPKGWHQYKCYNLSFSALSSFYGDYSVDIQRINENGYNRALCTHCKLFECKWKDCNNKDVKDLCMNHLKCCICGRCDDMIIKDGCICIDCGLLYCNQNRFECGADKRCKNCYIEYNNNNLLILIQKVVGNDFFKYKDMIDIIFRYSIGFEIGCCGCNEIVYGNNSSLGLLGVINNIYNEFYFYCIDKDIMIRNGYNYCIYRPVFGQFAVIYCTKCTMNLRPCKACQDNQTIADYCFNHYFL